MESEDGGGYDGGLRREEKCEVLARSIMDLGH